MRRRSLLPAVVSAAFLSVLGVGVAAAPLAVAAPAAATVDLGLLPLDNEPDVGHGTVTDLAFNITGSAADAAVTFSLPTGISLGDVRVGDSPDPRPCTPSAAAAACDLGAVGGITLVNATVQVASSVPIGTAVNVTAEVQPVGAVDPDPSNNAHTFTFTVVGHAEVSQSQNVRVVDVPLGASAPFVLTLHNAGPDAATGVRVDFYVQSNDATPPTLTAFSSPDVAQVKDVERWSVGTVPVGGSVSLTVTVSASSPVLDSELSYSTSLDGVGEVCDNPACLDGAQVRTFVPASGPGTTTTAPTPTAASSGRPTLAATGSADGSLLALGLVGLVGGAGLTVAGRRRPLR